MKCIKEEQFIASGDDGAEFSRCLSNKLKDIFLIKNVINTKLMINA